MNRQIIEGILTEIVIDMYDYLCKPDKRADLVTGC